MRVEREKPYPETFEYTAPGSAGIAAYDKERKPFHEELSEDRSHRSLCQKTSPESWGLDLLSGHAKNDLEVEDLV